MHTKVLLYSPFSHQTIHRKEERSLLLQFILSELFDGLNGIETPDPLEYLLSSSQCFFPFDWARKIGCVNKIYEHASLLNAAFPEEEERVGAFFKTLHTVDKRLSLYKKHRPLLPISRLKPLLVALYQSLYPFLLLTRSDENLSFFLLKNQRPLTKLIGTKKVSCLFGSMFPEGKVALHKNIRSEYEKRGFTTLLGEIDHLFAMR